VNDPLLVETTLAFFDRFLPPPPARLLVVGGDAPDLPAALAGRGHEVTAVDEGIVASRAPGGDRVRWLEADFLHHDAPEPYDVVAFAWALHRAAPVAAALDRARALLRPAGLLVAEELAFDRVNVHTARWLYDLETVLAAAGALLAPDPRFAAEGRPLLRWRQEHAADPPLVTGHDLLAAARERFALEAVEEAPYLFRYLADRIPEGAAGAAVLRAVFQLETRMTRERDIAAAGLRFVGRCVS